MDWQTTFTVIGGGAIVFLASWCFYNMQHTHEVTSELWEAINDMRKDITEHKLQVSKDFASVEHLKDVEGRVAKTLDSIDKKMDDLIKVFQEHIMWEQKEKYRDK